MSIRKHLIDTLFYTTIMDTSILQHLSNDPILHKAISEVGELQVPRATGDLYYDLVRTIAYQQLSGKAASTIFGRFIELFDDAYPHPSQVLDFEIEDLRAVGLSRQKGRYIQNIAAFAQKENLLEKDWNSLSDEEIIDFLTVIKGVGKWTVQMILMFTLERPDVFPIDDLGIRQGMIQLYDVASTGKAQRQELTQIAETWRPHRTTACRYVWAWKDKK